MVPDSIVFAQPNSLSAKMKASLNENRVTIHEKEWQKRKMEDICPLII